MPPNASASPKRSYKQKSFTDAYPSETFEDLDYFYSDYAIHLTLEEKQRELNAMRAAARKYKSQLLEDEARHFEAYVIYHCLRVITITPGD